MSAPSTEPNAVAAIRALDAEFMRQANAGDAGAMTDFFYADDATLLPPNPPPVQGKGAICLFWQAFMEALQPSNLKLNTTHIEASGDLAYGVGSYEFTAGGATHTGKYLVAFRRRGDGNYECVADSFSPNATS